MTKLIRLGMLAVVLALSGTNAVLAQKGTRGEFCRIWNVVCSNTCPGGTNCSAVCSLRRSNCLKDGCYLFNAGPGTRCDSSEADWAAARGGGEIVRALKAQGKL